MKKNIGIVGLGLIGASMAKAIKNNTKHKIFAMDKNEFVSQKALEESNIDFILDNSNISLCDTLIICVYPLATIEYVKKVLPLLSRGTVIVDCAGVKTNICQNLSQLANDYNCYFVGGHPMAGSEKSGYEHSYSHMFDNATMVLCKDEYTNFVALQYCKKLFEDIGFSKITFSTAQEHDKIIAFTSQLAHVVSNAYIQSEQAKMQMGFSAGSYKDLTRVAYLNETMWTELFLENKEALVNEIHSLAQRLEIYAKAIEENDSDTLMKILKTGKDMKENIG